MAYYNGRMLRAVHQTNSIKHMFLNGINAVKPDVLIQRQLKYEDTSSVMVVNQRSYHLNRNIKVIGFGKAVYGMAVEVNKLIGRHIIEGIITVPKGLLKEQDNVLSDSNIRVYEGAPNNLPDSHAEAAAQKIFDLVQASSKDDIIIALISGGGSALFPLPIKGITLEDKRLTIEALSKAGASITEINIVRQALSMVKGGKLASAAYPSQVIAFILSDIINSPLEYIASGPTVLQELDIQHALSIISKYKYEISKVSAGLVLKLMQSQKTVTQPSALVDVNNILIGSIEVALQSAADTAKALGYDTFVWSTDIQGEATAIADLYSSICKIVAKKHHDHTHTNTEDNHLLMSLTSPMSYTNLETILTCCNSPKLCLISGGEPTVTVKGNGKGGRNQELALALAKSIHDCGLFSDVIKIKFASVGTDGQDGPTNAAGAIIDNQTWRTALEKGLNPSAALANNDSYTLLSNLSDGEHLIIIGLTGTNVMDIHILLIEKYYQ